MKAVAIVLAVLCTLLAVDFARGQTWTLTGADTNDWTGIASSADGTKLAAVAVAAGAGIYLSTNSGTTWATSSAPAQSYESVASSADGTRLIAAGGYVYISTNSGGKWTLSQPSGNLVASSADGSKLMVVQTEGDAAAFIYVSTNSGASWFLGTNGISAQRMYWSDISCSSDGTKMAAVISRDGSPVYASTNCGLTWYRAPAIIGQPGAGIACAADGSKLMVATAGSFYVSTNWGLGWASTNSHAPNTGAATPDAQAVACSASGSTLLTYTESYQFDISTNLGASWTTNNLPALGWASFACSADGNQLVAVAEPGGIWILQTPPSPQLNESLSKGSLNLSWIEPSTNMVPEESPDLINWTPLTNAPSLNDSNLQEQLAIFGDQYQRLLPSDITITANAAPPSGRQLQWAGCGCYVNRKSRPFNPSKGVKNWHLTCGVCRQILAFYDDRVP